MTTRRGFLKFLGLSTAAPVITALPTPAIAAPVVASAPAVAPLVAPIAAVAAAAIQDWDDGCSMTCVILMEPRHIASIVNYGPVK